MQHQQQLYLLSFFFFFLLSFVVPVALMSTAWEFPGHKKKGEIFMYNTPPFSSPTAFHLSWIYSWGNSASFTRKRHILDGFHTIGHVFISRKGNAFLIPPPFFLFIFPCRRSSPFSSLQPLVARAHKKWMDLQRIEPSLGKYCVLLGRHILKFCRFRWET